MEKNDNFIELDILKLFKALVSHAVIIILVTLIFGSAAFGFTYAFIEPEYQASAMLYVNNSDISLGSTSFSISSATISAAQELVNTYIVILKTRTSLNEIIEYANLDIDYKELKNMISAAPVNSTEIFEVIVTAKDPQQSQIIANAIAKLLPNRISEIVEGSNVKIVDYAVTPTERSSPSYSKYTVLGMFVGFLISAGIVVLREIFDVYIKDENYLTQTYDLPVLATIPNIYSDGKSGSRKKGKKV